jgi:putative FmdB family regulatory protein
MPVYGYECAACGPFEAMRPMAEHDQPMDCPGCGAAAPRAFFTVPGLALMDAGTRTAMATNERSAHAPKVSGAVVQNACAHHGHDHGHGHGPVGHGHKKGRAVYGPDGSKTFPSSRPWMISH